MSSGEFFCTQCGAKLIIDEQIQQAAEIASSIPTVKLDKPMTPEVTAEQQNVSVPEEAVVVEKELLKVLIGRNADYYLQEFEKIDRGEKSFNIWALFFGPIIFLYRKQFSYFKKLVVPFLVSYEVLFLLFGYALATFNIYLIGALPFINFILLVFQIAVAIICAKGFNKQYKMQLHTVIAENQLTLYDEKFIKKNRPSALIPLVFFIVFFVLSFALNFGITTVSTYYLLNSYNETATVETETDSKTKMSSQNSGFTSYNNSSPTLPPPVVQSDPIGSINGSDVILRSQASVTGNELDYLQKGSQVTILSKYICEDQNAAVINISDKYVTYNGRSIHLQRGQAVEIQSFDGRQYFCTLKVGNNWVSGNLSPTEIRKIYGDTWYQVRLPNGKTGWVYGDYVTPF